MRRRFTRKYAGFIVSEATLREEYMIPAFINTLALIVPNIAQEYERQWEGLAIVRDTYGAHLAEIDYEKADMMLSDLFVELGNRAPIGCYFGAHPEDPALFGFWAED